MNKGRAMQGGQSLEAIINEGLRIALLEKTPDQSLEVLLGYLGKALDGDRTYIFERNASGCDDNTYEWVAEGIRPQKKRLQNVASDVCESWYRKFRAGESVVISDLEDIRENEAVLYDILKKQDIHSIVVVPLYDEGEVIGFYGVDNPPADSLEYATNILQITAHFIVSSMRRRNLIRELQDRSYDILRALNVDYLGIYEVDFDTDKCTTYRANDRLRVLSVNFDNGYKETMDWYISLCVVREDQKRLRTATEKSNVLARLREKKKFYVRYQVKDNPQGLKNMEIHFSVTDREENNVIFAFRDVNSVVEQEEKQIQETKRDIAEILEGARTGIWTMEMEDGCPPRLYADRTMRMLLGVPDDISPEDCYVHWFKHVEPDYVEMVMEYVKEIIRSGRAEVAYPWNHPELGKIYIRCGGIPDKTFDKPGFCVRGYHQDITETMVMRREHEKNLMESLVKVKQANSAKTEFLAHMSHDIRTPINGILGMLTISEKNPFDPEKQKECRTKIRTATEHLLSLMNDVLDISKLESGEITLAEEPFNLRDMLDNCMNIVSPKAEESGIRMEIREIDIRHSDLIGSPLHLRQIMINVMGNAVKYNRPKGSVFIWVNELSSKDGTANIQFVIEDTGIGMSEEFQKHIFEPFMQEHHGARTTYDGTGLGLSITKKLVDQMGGTIELESQPGVGTQFTITLPLKIDEKQGHVPEAEKEDDEPDDISGMRVLVAEDNELNCEIIQYMLKDAGASVVTAENGQIAADLFAVSEPGSYDCILMDLMMPVMDGITATRVIRSMDRPDAQTIPVIALSANSFAEDAKTAEEVGMDEHLTKPVDFKLLFKVMCRLRGKTEK